MSMISYSKWFTNVFHFIHKWDGSNIPTQITSAEWYQYLNDNSLQGGGGSWGNSSHGWVSTAVYPTGLKVDGEASGKSYISLQENNVNHVPADTVGVWWDIITTPDIGADSSLFTNVSGTTKMSGWDHVAAYKLSGHLFAQGPGVNTLIFNTPYGGGGQFISKSGGVGEVALRMSLTEDTCYTCSMITDGEGGTNIYFYKITNGSRSLIHSYYWNQELSNSWYTRFYVRGYTLGLDISTSQRTNSSNIAIDPIFWCDDYTTITEYTDPSPIPLSGHEYVGYRLDDGTEYPQVTHEGFGGEFAYAMGQGSEASTSTGQATVRVDGSVQATGTAASMPSGSAMARSSLKLSIRNTDLQALPLKTTGGAVAPFVFVEQSVLSVQDAVHAHAAEALAVVEDVTLVSAGALSAHTAEAPALTEHKTLALAEATSAQTIDVPTAIEHKTLALADAAMANNLDAPALTQAHTISVADQLHINATDALDLIEQKTLEVSDSLAGHATDAVDVAQAHVIAAASTSHENALAGAILTQDHLLALNDALSAQAAETLALVPDWLLEVADVTNSVTFDEPEFIEGLVLETAEAVHSQTLDEPTIVVHYLLEVQDVAHGHAPEEKALIQNHGLAPHDAVHNQPVDYLQLTTGELLQMWKVAHNHSAESPVLTPGHEIVVADMRHANGTDGISLTAAGEMVLADALHGMTLDSALVLQEHILEVSDLVHAHAADVPETDVSAHLLLDGILHAQAMDSVSITQAHAIAVAGGLHPHRLDGIDTTAIKVMHMRYVMTSASVRGTMTYAKAKEEMTAATCTGRFT